MEQSQELGWCRQRDYSITFTYRHCTSTHYDIHSMSALWNGRDSIPVRANRLPLYCLVRTASYL